MSHNTFRRGRLLAPVLLGGLLLAFQHARAEETCVTASCHAGVLKAKNAHAATESCTNCHEAAAIPHPQAGKKTFKLSSEVPALCNRNFGVRITGTLNISSNATRAPPRTSAR